MAKLNDFKLNLGQIFPGDLKILEQNKTRITYLKGENIFKQGAFAPYVIYVVSGLVKVYLQTGYEKQINISIARNGDFLAFSSIFGENIHTYVAQGQRKRSLIKGFLISEPEKTLPGLKISQPNPYLSLLS